MVPNGVILIDLLSQDIEFANKEMEKLVNKVCGDKPLTFKERICSFLFDRYVSTSAEDESKEEPKGIKTSQCSFASDKDDSSIKAKAQNLWDYLIQIHEDIDSLSSKHQSIFKTSDPECYIQVNTSLIN